MPEPIKLLTLADLVENIAKGPALNHDVKADKDAFNNLLNHLVSWLIKTAVENAAPKTLPEGVPSSRGTNGFS